MTIAKAMNRHLTKSFQIVAGSWTKQPLLQKKTTQNLDQNQTYGD